MRDVRDRRDLACLGLTVLVYGLVVAPVLHAVESHEGGLPLPAMASGWLDHQKPSAPTHEHGHSHDPGKRHHHSWGSVEHLQAVAVSCAVVLAPVVGWLLLRAAVFQAPEWRLVASLRPTAMPQGP